MPRFISSLFIIVGVSLLQTSNIFIFGAKPNLPLVFLIALSLINKPWIERLILALASVVFLNFYSFSISNPVLDLSILSFAIVAVASIAALDYLPWAHSINLIIVVSSATILLNLYNFNLNVAIFESSYNMILTFLILALIPKNYVEQEIKRY